MNSRRSFIGSLVALAASLFVRPAPLEAGGIVGIPFDGTTDTMYVDGKVSATIQLDGRWHWIHVMHN